MLSFTIGFALCFVSRGVGAMELVAMDMKVGEIELIIEIHCILENYLVTSYST